VTERKLLSHLCFASYIPRANSALKSATNQLWKTTHLDASFPRQMRLV
jgi:hypothetical protein